MSAGADAMGTPAQSQFEHLVGVPRTACANAGDSDLDCGHSCRMLRATHGSVVPAEGQARNNPLGDRLRVRGAVRRRHVLARCISATGSPAGPGHALDGRNWYHRRGSARTLRWSSSSSPSPCFTNVLSRSDRLVCSHGVMLTVCGADAGPNSEGPERVLQSVPGVGRHGAMRGSECI